MTAITPPQYPARRPPTGPLPPPPSRHPQLARPPETDTRSRVARIGLVALAVVIIAVSIAIDAEALIIVPLLFILVVPFEKLFPRHRQKVRRPQLGTDLAYAMATPLLGAIGTAGAIVVGVISFAWLPGLAVRPLVSMIPAAVQPLVAILVFDVLIYWTHRWYHEVPFLWRFHAIHHSTEHLDWISGIRNHPFDGTLLAPAFVFLLAAGFNAQFTGALAAVQIITGIFLHANVRWRLRWLHKLIITPEFHHWHHANEPGAINSNYSVFLPAWDLVFGTYFMPKNRRPQVYGVAEHIPAGMVPQLWYPLRGMGNPLRVVAHPVKSTKGGLRFVWKLLGEMKRSALRPRRQSHDDVGSWPATGTETSYYSTLAPAVPVPLPLPLPSLPPAPMPPPPSSSLNEPPPPTAPMPSSTVVFPPSMVPTQPWPAAGDVRPTSLAEAMNWDRTEVLDPEQTRYIYRERPPFH